MFLCQCICMFVLMFLFHFFFITFSGMWETTQMHKQHEEDNKHGYCHIIWHGFGMWRRFSVFLRIFSLGLVGLIQACVRRWRSGGMKRLETFTCGEMTRCVMPFALAIHGKMMNHWRQMSKNDGVVLLNELHGLDIEDAYSECKKLKGTRITYNWRLETYKFHHHKPCSSIVNQGWIGWER